VGVGVKPIRACLCLWSQRPSLLWCSPAGAVQCTARLRYVLETVRDVFEGYLVCGGILLYPHARPKAELGPTSSSGLRVPGCQCTTLPPQLLLLASKTARVPLIKRLKVENPCIRGPLSYTRNAARRPGSGGRPRGCGFEEQGGGMCAYIEGVCPYTEGVYPYSHFV